MQGVLVREKSMGLIGCFCFSFNTGWSTMEIIVKSLKGKKNKFYEQGKQQDNF